MKVPRPFPLPLVVALLVAIFGLLGLLTLLTFHLAEQTGLPFEWTIFPVLVLLTFGSVGAVLWKFARARKLVLRNQEAVVLLNQGRPTEAAAIFDALIRESRGLRNLRARFLMNRAVAHLHLDEPEAAVELALPLLQAGWFQGQLAAYHGPGVATALTPLILLDRLEEAEVILRRELPRVPETQRGALLPPRMLLALRRGRRDELLALAIAERSAAEAILPVRALRLVDLLHALALQENDPERADAMLGALELDAPGLRPYLARVPELSHLATGPTILPFERRS
ncbi:MAG: hypothetical protein P1V51_22295 [Deltaproteobacteria bacterium]|nr:hypothetical protein [Deltaproteobacteria bacterium]